MLTHDSAISYDVALLTSSPHTLEVTLRIANPAPQGQILSLPAWIPGSYMIRDFAKNITKFEPTTLSGTPLDFTKIDKQTWRLAPTEEGIVIHYHIYAFDLSIRSAYICDEYLFFNGTSVFLQVHGQEEVTTSVKLHKPKQPQQKHWRVATAMSTAPNTSLHEFGEYYADDYQELIDHPVVIGDFDLLTFKQDGVDFELVLAGGHQADTDRISKDLKAICHHHIALFGSEPPVNRYMFLTLLTHDGFGGLEHRSSTALLYSRDDLPNKLQDEMTEGYRTFLSLCSHEFFHTWHVKRIRPEELKTADLKEEVYTPQLWIYEGFTSYYDDFSLLRAGVIDQQSYLELAGQNLTRLLRNSGRFKQTVTESSYYAWTKFYKQDASAINNIVSYYNKGAVIAMCLDLLIRRESDHKLSLDDVMIELWQNYGKVDKGTHEGVIHEILADLNLELDGFLKIALHTTEELPVSSLLESFGVELKYRSRIDHKDKGGKVSDNTVKHAFGANFTSLSTGVKITQVSEDGPAFKAGIQIGDQLISANNQQVNQSNLQSKLDQCETASTATLHVLRDHKLKTFEIAIEKALEDTVYLQISDTAASAKWLENN